LKLKKKIWKKYEDSFIALEDRSLDSEKLVIRLVKIFLLTIGLSETLLGSGIIDPLWFATATRIADYATHRIKNPIYIPEVLVGCRFLILPLIIDLWSIGWIFEDSGLMHHKFPPKEKIKLNKIEPI
jgi:hypothetical protein